MTDGTIAQLKALLVSTAGGFLRNVGGPGTCGRCFTPTDAGVLCPPCQQRSVLAGMPDALGFMTYAGFVDPISQSGQVMRGYKSPYAQSGTAKTTVGLLAALALQGHGRCSAALVGQPVNAWATVPSLPPKNVPHTLNGIVSGLSRRGSSEVVLHGIARPANPREVNGEHFIVSGAPRGGHVLLVDDTWTSGGHALSAALALRAAGVEHVSVLALARWLTLGWEATTAEWAKHRLTTPDYSTELCPWTQGSCP